MIWFLIWVIGVAIMAATLIALAYLREVLNVEFSHEFFEDFTSWIVDDVLDVAYGEGWVALALLSMFWPFTVLIATVFLVAVFVVAPALKRALKSIIKEDN